MDTTVYRVCGSMILYYFTYTAVLLQEAVHSKIKRQLEIGCVEFPRLCFLTESDVVRVVSHSGSPMTIAPLISRVFPAVQTIRFGELLTSNSAVHQQTHDSKEGMSMHM